MGQTLEVFFTGKYFRIPNYQRDYSWDIDNVDDLIDDIIEAIETNTGHYIGTFILSETELEKTFNVVDGQQRLTTLILLLNKAIHSFGSERDQIIYGDRFIHSNGRLRLHLLNDNQEFFEDLLKGNLEEPGTASQKKLAEAYDWIGLRISDLKDRTLIVDKFIDTIRNLDVMEFTESNDGKAIRMFQTVNDRGKPLSNMEKAKSLLIYYSNRFLETEFDDYINQKFGDIFHYYTTIKTLGTEFKVDVIDSSRFSEDSVMRYHYLAYAEDNYDHGATESDVLDNYLKKHLKSIRSEKKDLWEFIKDYTDDLHSFFEAFVNLMEKLNSNPRVYKLFSILGISTRLYPLLIRLEEMGLLNSEKHADILLDLVEVADLRVYKIRGTDPRADMSYLARDTSNLKVEEIKERLSGFVRKFMGNAEFNRRLQLDIYPNPALKHIFIEYEEESLRNQYPVGKLIELNELNPTVEHIFSREPTFDFPNHGFEDDDEYAVLSNSLGNLTLLEKELNSRCANKTPDQKLSKKLYGSSRFHNPQKLCVNIQNEGVPFTKDHVTNRLEELTDFCMDHWNL